MWGIGFRDKLEIGCFKRNLQDIYLYTYTYTNIEGGKGVKGFRLNPQRVRDVGFRVWAAGFKGLECKGWCTLEP